MTNVGLGSPAYMRRIAATLLVVFAFTACRSSVDWKNHISIRSTGTNVKLSQVDPREVIVGRISRNLHYVSVALDAVFFRDLPNVGDGTDVAFGFEMQGVLPEGATIKTVPDVVKASGPHAFLNFDNLVVLEPFLYTGQNITITLHFRATAGSEATGVRGRIQGGGDMLKRLDPRKSAALDTATQLFSSVIGLAGGDKSWKYSFTLYPSDSVIRDKPDVLFTASRHILLAVPPGDAPKEIAAVKPHQVFHKLQLRGNRLIWKDSEEEYTAAPYIILNITRYKRYPKPDTDLRKLISKIDTLYENGTLDLAKSHLATLGAVIGEDKVITAREKNLERSWKDFREARIDAATARRANDRRAELGMTAKQLRVLLQIKEQFRDILEPHEATDIDYKMSTLLSQAVEITKETNEPIPDNLSEAVKQDQAGERKRKQDEEAEAARILKALAPIAQAPTAEGEGFVPPSGRPIYKKWWFWAVVGGVVAAGGLTTFMVTRGPGKTETGICVTPPC